VTRKDSVFRLAQHGIERFPANWTQSRVKYLGTYINGYPFKPEDWGTVGRPILRIQDLSSTNGEPNRFDGEIPDRYLVRPLDILISWSASLGVYRWSGEEAWLNQHIFKVALDAKRIRDDFFVWLAEWFIDEMDREVHGSTMQHLTADAFGGFPVLLPPHEEQARIAHYLDCEMARLDALVEAKQRVLGLLIEKRRALITHAVTRGLDHRAPLRDSGVPWLGEIPAHWELTALRFLVDIFGGATPNTGKSELWDGDIPWVSPKDMKREEIADAEDHVSLEALEGSALRLIDPVAVLVVVRGMILAHSFPTATTTRQVTINQDMKALRCCTFLDPHFLRDFFWGLESHLLSLVDSAAHGTRKLETEALGRFQVCIPPMAEQLAIVEYIADRTARLDKLRAATERTISLLKNRRAALIAAAVTGQIDVGNIA
jgi:type I restriction enzyme S subunit